LESGLEKLCFEALFKTHRVDFVLNCITLELACYQHHVG
jgi:hypothetical protein